MQGGDGEQLRQTEKRTCVEKASARRAATAASSAAAAGAYTAAMRPILPSLLEAREVPRAAAAGAAVGASVSLRSQFCISEINGPSRRQVTLRAAVALRAGAKGYCRRPPAPPQAAQGQRREASRSLLLPLLRAVHCCARPACGVLRPALRAVRRQAWTSPHMVHFDAAIGRAAATAPRRKGRELRGAIRFGVAPT